jgi:hypothetical protein
MLYITLYSSLLLLLILLTYPYHENYQIAHVLPSPVETHALIILAKASAQIDFSISPPHIGTLYAQVTPRYGDHYPQRVYPTHSKLACY